MGGVIGTRFVAPGAPSLAVVIGRLCLGSNVSFLDSILGGWIYARIAYECKNKEGMAR